jgi:VWFA-related protein
MANSICWSVPATVCIRLCSTSRFSNIVDMGPVALRVLQTAMPAALFFLTAAAVPAQEDVGLRLRADTRVVQIEVLVRDSQGKPIEDLRKDDFTVSDNGKPRAFSIFSVNRALAPGSGADGASARQATLPIPAAPPPNTFTNLGQATHAPQGHSTIILIDGINGWFENFDWARKGVLGMLAKIPADERIALYVLSNFKGTEILQDYTTDRDRLIQVLTDFIPRGMSPAPPYIPNDSEGFKDNPAASSPPALRYMTKAPARETQFRLQMATDTVRSSLNDLAANLKNLPGRKSLFWVTQGFPPFMLRDINGPAWDKTFSLLNDANIAVNTVDSNGLGGPPRYWGPGAVLAMQQIADETGGHSYYNRNDLDGAIASGIADSRSSYTLGFYLTDLDGKYHELKVHTSRSGLQLNYRQGYFARNETVVDSAQKGSELEAAMLNPLNSTGVGLTARLDITPGTPRNTLNTYLRVDPESLSLKETATGWRGKMEQVFLELNATGRELARVSVTKQFELTAATKAKYDSQGITMAQDLQFVPGAVKLSIIVRDTASGRVGSLIVPLENIALREAGK